MKFAICFFCLFSATLISLVSPHLIQAATISSLSYGPSGSTVGTYVAASDTDFVVFTPITAMTTGSTVTITFPTGTALTSANIATTDFTIVQATQGLCVVGGVDTVPTVVSVNESNRTVTFTVASASLSLTAGLLGCGTGQVTIKTSALFAGNEIRHPTTVTSSGSFQVATSVGDSGSLSNISFVADAPHHLKVTGTANQTAGTTNELTVTAYDQYDNTATGYSGSKSLTFSGLSTANDGTVPIIEGITQGSSTSVSFSSGVSAANAATLIAYKAESASIDVSDGSINSTGNSSYDLDLTVTNAAASTLAVSSGNSQSAVVTVALASDLVAIVRDDYENPVSGTTVSFAISSTPSSATGQSLTASSDVSDASGVVNTSLTVGTKVGTYQVQASSVGLNTITFSATGTAETASYLKITGATSQTAGTTNELTVTAYDQYDNTATGYSGSKSLTFSGLSTALDSTVPTFEGTNQGSSTSVTFSNGISATNGVTVVAYKAESASIDVTDGTINTTGDTSYDLDLTVIAATASSLSKNSGDTQTAAVNATLSSDLVAKLTDDYDNPVSGGTVSFSISSTPSGASGQSLSVSSDSTDGSGLAATALTLGNTAGSYQVLASVSGVGSVSFSATATDTTEPSISSISITPASTSVTVTWTSNEASSSQLNYGVTSAYGSNTSESDTAPRVTSHSTQITGLLECTNYHLQVVSTDYSSNQGTSSDQTFITTGCLGSSSVLSHTTATITTTSGGSTSLLSSGKGLSLTVPSAFAGSDAYFQIKQLSKNEVLATAPLSGALSSVANYVYELDALTSVTTKISSFNQPISVTLLYSESDLAGASASALRIYRWTGTAWSELSSCTVDTTAQSVTCVTTAFSVFVLAAQPASSPSFSSSSSGSGSSSSTPQPSVCSVLPPGSAPWLYAGETLGATQVTLYFGEAGDPVSHYVLEYGPSPSNYTYGSQDIGGKGSRRYTVSHLKSNMQYYFRVRGSNDCATGPWSNELAIKTWPWKVDLDLSQTLNINETSRGDQVSEQQIAQPTHLSAYTLKIRLTGPDGRPLKNAVVTLYSTPKTGKTDQNGEVVFEDVEYGNHELVVESGAYNGQQSLFVTGDKENISLDIQVSPQPLLLRVLSPRNLLLFSVVGGLILTTSASLGLFGKKPHLYSSFHRRLGRV